MNVNDAIAYLRRRTDEIGNRYRDKYPKWNNDDYASVRVLLTEIAQRQQRSADDGPCQCAECVEERNRVI